MTELPVAAPVVATGTQLLRPGAYVAQCEWHFPWEPPESMGLGDLIARHDEATLVQKLTVSTESLHLGLAVRTCTELRGDLARPIRTIMVPLVGGDAHHGHHGH